MAPHTHRTAGIYLRQSQFTDGSISIDLQERLAREFAARQGWEVRGVWSDEDTSGRHTSNRPGLKALRAAHKRGEFDIAVAHAVSRFARNMSDGAEIIGEMPLATVLEGVQDEDDDFIPLLHALLAHKQSQEIAKRWKETRDYRTAQGLPASGGPRFGYVYTKALVTREDGTTVRTAPEDTYRIDPDLAPVVSEMYAMFLRGNGFNSITEFLNAGGHPTTRGGTWNVSKVYDYMDKGFAAGMFKVDDDLVRGIWEPIISEDTWKAYTRARKARKTKSPRERGSSWELTGIARCDKCGGPLSLSLSHGDYYARCSRYKNAGPSVCTGVTYLQNSLTRQAYEFLDERIGEWIKALPSDEDERNALEARLARIDADLEDVKAIQGRLASGWASGLLDDSGYRSAKAEQDDRKASLTAERDDVDVELAAHAPVYGEFYGGGLDEAMAGTTTAEAREVYSKLFQGIYVSDEHVRFVAADGEAVTVEKLSARHRGARQRNKAASGVHRAVKAWAVDQGMVVPKSGPVSLSLIEAWESATGNDRSVSPS